MPPKEEVKRSERPPAMDMIKMRIDTIRSMRVCLLISDSILMTKVYLPDVRETLTGAVLSTEQESPYFSKLDPGFRGE